MCFALAIMFQEGFRYVYTILFVCLAIQIVLFGVVFFERVWVFTADDAQVSPQDVYELPTGTVLVRPSILLGYHSGTVIHRKDVHPGSRMRSLMDEHEDAIIFHFSDVGILEPSEEREHVGPEWFTFIDWIQRKAIVNLATADQFAAGQTVFIGSKVTFLYRPSSPGVGERAAEVMRKNDYQYSIFWQNCQHLANHVATGRRISVSLLLFTANIATFVAWCVAVLCFIPPGPALRRSPFLRKLLGFLCYRLHIDRLNWGPARLVIFLMATALPQIFLFFSIGVTFESYSYYRFPAVLQCVALVAFAPFGFWFLVAYQLQQYPRGDAAWGHVVYRMMSRESFAPGIAVAFQFVINYVLLVSFLNKNVPLDLI